MLRRKKPDGDLAAVTSDDGRLPRDILHEVLLRLPPDALCRARLVCRSWRSLASDPRFTEEHSSRHVHIAALHAERDEVHIVDLSGNVLRRVPIDATDAAGGYRSGFKVSTQVGAICVSRLYKPSAVLRSGGGGITITTLPKCVASASLSPLLLVRVPSTGEYKVLHFRSSSREEQWSYVTTVVNGGGGGGSWRVGPRKVVPPVRTGFRHRAVIAGVAYFLVDPYNRSSAGMEPDSVASFDLEREEWMRPPIRGPLSSLLAMEGGGGGRRCSDNNLPYLQVAELGGRLAMVHSKDHERLVDIWIMVDMDNGAWCKVFSLEYAPELAHYRFLYPLVILDQQRIVAWMDLEGIMRAYDPRTGTWTTVMDTGEKYVTVGRYVGGVL